MSRRDIDVEMADNSGRSPLRGSGSCPPGGAEKSSPAKPAIPNAPWDRLRNTIRENFSLALARDPACNGRVTTATLDWLADEAIRACESTRKATEHYLLSERTGA